MTIFGLQNNSFEGELVEIQCTIHQGFPSFDISGLGDSIIQEAKDRIRAAIRASRLRFPQETILVNLLPPNSKKTGTALDLPIALSILFAKSDINAKILALGELDLHGTINSTPGCEKAIELGIKKGCNIIIVPKKKNNTATVCNDDLKKYGVIVIESSLLGDAFEEIVDTVNNCEQNHSLESTSNDNNTKTSSRPFLGIIGLRTEKEALVVSAAGGHNLLFFGARGVGKSMLLSRYKNLLPPLDEKTLNELSKIRSNFNLFPSTIGECLYLDNSNKSSVLSNNDKSQEILLFHGGSIIIDEITKMDEKVLSTLQNIHDTGVFNANKGDSYPLRFNILGSFNPCPCGALGSRRSVCYCAENRIQSHLKNINTPFLSRFDIVLDVNEADFLHDDDSGFDNVKEKIENATKRQNKRYKDEPFIRRNGDLAIFNRSSEYIRKAYMYFPESENPRDALLHYGVALTLSDLDDEDEIQALHIEKAKLMKVLSPKDYYKR